MARSVGLGKRCIALLVTLALALLLAPTPATASTLERDDFRLDGKPRAEIRYTAETEASFVNVIRVRRVRRTYLFTDSESITAASPCSLTGTTARCGVPGVSHVVEISTGERADRVRVVGSVPTEVDGGPDNDVVLGGTGGDSFLGGDGSDVLRGSGGNDALQGLYQNDRLSGGSGHDVLYGDEGRDRLAGGRGRDSLDGGPQNDVLIGGRGDDELAGDDGNNRLSGGAGNDRIWATSRGRDVVSCGHGFDHAFVSRNDRVVGCERVFASTERRPG
jgi:RTX calcium-binding nonapeptide repeat (4 copies)